VSRDVQPPEPAVELLRVATAVTSDWLRRSIESAAIRAGVDPSVLGDELDRVVGEESARLLDALAGLLATDVDEQRSTPLSLYRDSIVAPTALLRAAGVRAAVDQAYGDDVYGLGPATWSDIDPAMHEPGLAWGAWKAMTVLRRRRDEGRR
jgi:hypothetical protein